jgi:hypothetical protein
MEALKLIFDNPISTCFFLLIIGCTLEACCKALRGKP